MQTDSMATLHFVRNSRCDKSRVSILIERFNKAAWGGVWGDADGPGGSRQSDRKILAAGMTRTDNIEQWRREAGITVTRGWSGKRQRWKWFDCKAMM